MSEQQDSPEQDYLDQIEQHELTKAAGIDAWAEAVAGMLPNMDPDKAILIKEGLKAALGGPPKFPPLQFPGKFMPPVDAEFIPPPSHIFEQHENGAITVWDWMCLASRGTHATLYPDGRVDIFKGIELVISLTGEAATKFWEWKSEALKHYAGMPIYIPGSRGV